MTPPNPTLERTLEPPRRGDEVARQWSVAALVIYGVVAGMFAVLIIDSWRDPEPVLLVLLAFGLTLTGVGYWFALKDVRSLKVEEDDVEWIRQKGREGLEWVLAPAEQREDLFARRIKFSGPILVDTLADDRVRRYLKAQERGGAINPEELRVLAQARSDRIGGFVRFAASALLLLTVLGTFAGIKTALPGLITAVSSDTTGGSRVPAASSAANSETTGTAMAGGISARRQLPAALDRVQGAFGSNALALIGAIALTIAAHGLRTGRQHLLERLELVSAEHIYQGDANTASNPLQAAVGALRVAAKSVEDAANQLTGLQQTMEGLDTTMGSAFAGLGRQLTDLAVQDRETLYHQTGQALDRLQARVHDIAQVVQANANVYQGIVEVAQRRAAETGAAIEALRGSGQQLEQTLRAAVGVSEKATATAQALDVAASAVREVAVPLREDVSGLKGALQQSTTMLTKHLAESVASQEKSANQWAAAVQAGVAQLREASVVVPVSRPSGAVDREVASELRRLTHASSRVGRLLLILVGVGAVVQIAALVAMLTSR